MTAGPRAGRRPDHKSQAELGEALLRAAHIDGGGGVWLDGAAAVGLEGHPESAADFGQKRIVHGDAETAVFRRVAHQFEDRLDIEHAALAASAAGLLAVIGLRQRDGQINVRRQTDFQLGVLGAEGRQKAKEIAAGAGVHKGVIGDLDASAAID